MPRYIRLEETIALLMVFGHQQRTEVLSWTLREIGLMARGVAYWTRKKGAAGMGA